MTAAAGSSTQGAGPHRVQLLGDVRVDDAPVSGARLRALLVALALVPGRVVSAAALVDAVWDGDVPDEPTGALQALVSRLRRSSGLPVEAVAGGYRLPAATVAVDAVSLRTAALRARDALAGGRPGEAAALARAAMDGWTGGWEDGAGRHLPRQEAARLAEVRRELLAVRARALLAGAGTGRAVPLADHTEDPRPGELPDLLAQLGQATAGPVPDEPLIALHVRLLVAAGRAAQALDRYERAREELAELGSDASAELRAAHAEALRASVEPTPGTRADPAREVPAQRVPAAAGQRGALDDVGVGGARLPEALLGRDADLGALADRVRDNLLVTLVGPGGVGKTTLVTALAHQWRAAGEPVVEVPLAGLRADADVLPVVLAALGGRRRTAADADGALGRTAEEELARAAVGARGLLVLDNCEHLLDAVADVVLGVCAVAPADVRVVATSRAPLGVLGEQVQLLRPLDPSAARNLVMRRAAAVRPGADLALPPLRELCERLDNLPLALELAAARLRTMSLPDLLAAREHGETLLPGGPRGLPERHRSLQALVDWSWELLDEPARVLLRRMAVFPAGAHAAAVAAVCADPEGSPGAHRSAPAGTTEAAASEEPGAAELPAASVPAALASLVDASLVVWEPDEGGGRGRYRLLETVREYAESRSTASEVDLVAGRHARWAAALAEGLVEALRDGRQVAALREAAVERDGLAAALRWAAVAGDVELVSPIGLLLVLASSMRGAHPEVVEWVEILLRAPSVLDPGDAGRRLAAALDGPSLARVWRASAEATAVGAPNLVVAGAPRQLAALLSRLRRAGRRPELLGDGLTAFCVFLQVLVVDVSAVEVGLIEPLVGSTDPWWRTWGLLARAWWSENNGLDDLGLADAREAHSLMDGSGNAAGRAVAASFVAERLSGGPDPAASLAWWEASERDSLLIGAEGDARQARLFRLRTVAQLAVDDPQARRDVAEAIAEMAAAHPDDDLVLLTRAAAEVSAHREAGDLPAARRAMSRTIADLPGWGQRVIPQLVAALHCGATLLALEDGDDAGADEHVRLAVEAAVASHDVPAQASTAEAVARWAVARGDAAGGARLAALAARFGSRLEAVLGWGPTALAVPAREREDAARAVEDLDGPAAVVLMRELLALALR